MRGRKKKESSGVGGTPLWMTTYGDLMSLLMCFFVLLFAFSQIDTIKFREVVISLKGALGVLDGGPQLLNPGELPAPKAAISQLSTQEKMKRLKKVMEKMENYLESKGLSNNVELSLSKRGLTVRFKDTVLFDLGKAAIRPEGKLVLTEMSDIIRTIPNNIVIEGYTDDLPLRKNAEFPTNWELSTTRATTVLRYLIEARGIAPERLSAMGYGEYKPIVPNNSAENRAKNRRVDIVIVEPSMAEEDNNGGQSGD